MKFDNRIPKRTLVTSQDEIKETFGLPDEIEIVGIRIGHGVDEGLIFFDVVSRNPIEGVTVQYEMGNNIRRLRMSIVKDIVNEE